MTAHSHLLRDQDGGSRGIQQYRATRPSGSGLSRPRPWFLKRMVTSGACATPKVFPTIQSLDNFIAEHASPLPSAPTVGVLNLAQPFNLLYVFQAPKGVHSGRKIYTGSSRTSLLAVISGLLPAPLMIKTHSNDYKWAREGGEAPKSLFWGGSGALESTRWSPS
jgi:hypothetical protein